jgi:hypothetical protein
MAPLPARSPLPACACPRGAARMRAAARSHAAHQQHEARSRRVGRVLPQVAHVEGAQRDLGDEVVRRQHDAERGEREEGQEHGLAALEGALEEDRDEQRKQQGELKPHGPPLPLVFLGAQLVRLLRLALVAGRACMGRGAWGLRAGGGWRGLGGKVAAERARGGRQRAQTRRRAAAGAAVGGSRRGGARQQARRRVRRGARGGRAPPPSAARFPPAHRRRPAPRSSSGSRTL